MGDFEDRARHLQQRAKFVAQRLDAHPMAKMAGPAMKEAVTLLLETVAVQVDMGREIDGLLRVVGDGKTN